MWRWSLVPLVRLPFLAVFSTYVEVILRVLKIWWIKFCILHVCGGDPSRLSSSDLLFLYSPRMWRWSLKSWDPGKSRTVFSTYVEVILKIKTTRLQYCSILHVCGGDPGGASANTDAVLYSPRMWRWSLECSRRECFLPVFSTYVEVILWDLLIR